MKNSQKKEISFGHKMINVFEINQLKIINQSKGNLFKGLSINDNNYFGFGEIYFTSIYPNLIKGWKKHLKMTSNIIVLKGNVKFVIIEELKENNKFNKVVLNEKNRQILTIFPNNWFAFQGLGDEESLVTNISNIPHSDNEVINKKIDEFKFDWEKK